MPPLVGVPPKKYVEDIPMVQGEVHAKFSPDPSSSLGGEWRQTNKQTDRQTDTPFCYISIDFIIILIHIGGCRGDWRWSEKTSCLLLREINSVFGFFGRDLRC